MTDQTINPKKEEKVMRKWIIGVAVLSCVMFLGGIAIAQEKGPVERVLDGCSKELKSYCKNVTPGEGHLLACLYAYEDKLSTRCEYALYDAVDQLDRAVTALSYLANECRDDLKKYCSDVKPGEGRLLDCLDKKKDVIGDRCKTAFKDVLQK
ncbi:MAG TPA: cysteine rich repeat-containing protein [Thermodesulfobacteriota bacterium]|nr:cysteine rich repeat-containing protein [Thermodesulfobacteriota bacterium]